MKYYSRLYTICFIFFKFIIISTLIYLLLTTLNTLCIKQFLPWVDDRFLTIFPKNQKEQLNFLKIIIMLGVSFITFARTLYVLMDISTGAKDIIKYHSTSFWQVHLKTIYIVCKVYLIDYGIFLTSLIAMYHFVYQIFPLDMPSLQLLGTWFIVDILMIYVIQKYAKNAVTVLILFTVFSMVRKFIMLYLPYMILLVIVDSYLIRRED